MNSSLPDPRFLQAVNCLRDDENAIKVSIKSILDFDFKQDRIQALDPSALALDFASHIGIFFGDETLYTSRLRGELKELVEEVWNEKPRSGYRSVIIKDKKLGVTITIQIQTNIVGRPCVVLGPHREDLACFISLSNTHDSEGDQIKNPLTVYCCGKITAVRLWGLCGMYYGADIEPDKKTPKVQFMKKTRRCMKSSSQDEFAEEKERLLM